MVLGSKRLVADKASPRSYVLLRNQVKETLVLGQRKIEQAKVQTYWRTGWLIDRYLSDHVPAGKERAEYSKQIMARLSEDLETDVSVLYRCMRFAQCFKKLAARPLSWTHYRLLIPIADDKLREAFARRASEEGWSADLLETKIRREIRGDDDTGDESDPDRTHLKAKLGKIGTYRIIRRELVQTEGGELLLDLGFSVYKNLSPADQKRFKDGDIVTANGIVGAQHACLADRRAVSLQRLPGATVSDLFTYKVYIERIVDGDTLRVKVDLGFDTWTRQYLRLRGIDCPEIVTGKGKEAREFVESALAKSNFIVIQTTRSDKYDRYLADVFIPSASLRGDAQAISSVSLRGDAQTSRSNLNEFIYLNQLLLDRGLAVRVRE